MRVVLLILLLILLSCTKHTEVGKFSDCGDGYDINGMKLIDPTDQPFFMGSSLTDAYSDEKPVHSVSLSRRFWIDTVEVSQKKYDSVMTVAGHVIPNWRADDGLGDNYPAYNVSWGDAVLYCNARSIMDGLDTIYSYSDIRTFRAQNIELIEPSWDLSKNGYRLPSESEWEFAARAGADTLSSFFWGSSTDDEQVSLYSWYSGNSPLSSSDNISGSKEVATTTPNNFGLYDMIGNVSEWCTDYYSAGYYALSPADDPVNDMSDDRGWVIRGGHWYIGVEGLRLSARNGSETYSAGTGFRTVRNAD